MIIYLYGLKTTSFHNRSIIASFHTVTHGIFNVYLYLTLNPYSHKSSVSSYSLIRSGYSVVIDFPYCTTKQPSNLTLLSITSISQIEKCCSLLSSCCLSCPNFFSSLLNSSRAISSSGSKICSTPLISSPR